MGSRTKRKLARKPGGSKRVDLVVKPKGARTIASGVEYTIKIMVADRVQPSLASELRSRVPQWVDLWGEGNVRASVTARRVRK